MRFTCQPVGAEFLEHAPKVFRHSVEIAAPAARIFRLLEDGEAWPRWFTGIRKVEWTSPQPFGVGTTRVVTLDAMTLHEHFFRWEPARRFSFYLTGASLPLWHAFAEDYLLEPAGTGTRFTHTVALRPRLLQVLAAPRVYPQLENMFRAACANLVTYAPIA